MKSLREIPGLLKRHYEKAILVLALLGLIAAVVYLNNLKTTKEYLSRAELAVLYIGLGDKEGALAELEKAYSAHDAQLQYLKADPHYDSLRSDPRFTDLISRVRLPQ